MTFHGRLFSKLVMTDRQILFGYLKNPTGVEDIKGIGVWNLDTDERESPPQARWNDIETNALAIETVEGKHKKLIVEKSREYVCRKSLIIYNDYNIRQAPEYEKEIWGYKFLSTHTLLVHEQDEPEPYVILDLSKESTDPLFKTAVTGTLQQYFADRIYMVSDNEFIVSTNTELIIFELEGSEAKEKNKICWTEIPEESESEPITTESMTGLPRLTLSDEKGVFVMSQIKDESTAARWVTFKLKKGETERVMIWDTALSQLNKRNEPPKKEASSDKRLMKLGLYEYP